MQKVVFKNINLSSLSKYFNLYVLISFLGWLWETAYLFFSTGNLFDRGFLTLPFCPIYATVLLSLYFVLGTLEDRRGISKYIYNNTALIIIYFCMSFLLPTLAELLVGTFFLNVFNMRLWDYTYLEFNSNGHIALEISTMWALAIFFFMNKIFPHLKRLVFKLNEKTSKTVSVIFSSAIFIDLVYCAFKNIRS